MALYLKTQNPAKLLAEFKKQIDDKKVETWDYDNEGDFTHIPPQWKNKAWMRPVIKPGILAFNFRSATGETTSRVVYGVYHGRLIESLLTHCDRLFETADATAMAAAGDYIHKKAA